jgi:hypothetical protein
MHKIGLFLWQGGQGIWQGRLKMAKKRRAAAVVGVLVALALTVPSGSAVADKTKDCGTTTEATTAGGSGGGNGNNAQWTDTTTTTQTSSCNSNSDTGLTTTSTTTNGGGHPK